MVPVIIVPHPIINGACIIPLWIAICVISFIIILLIIGLWCTFRN